MKKSILFILLVFILSMLCACSFMKSEDPLTVRDVYLMAKDAGYKGSFDDFMDHFSNSASKGEQGETGEKGEKGDTGEQGQDGKDGSRWYNGETPPEKTLGKDGDYYLHTSTFDIYAKSEGSWGKIGNIKGESGDSIDSPEATSPTLDTPRETAHKALLSSVSVICTNGSSYSTGAGVIYKLDKESGDAYVITNYHVVYNESAYSISKKIDILIYGKGYTQFAIPATFVGGSSAYDLAIIKVSGSEIIKTSELVEAHFANSDDVRVLDVAIAVGNPKGEGMSATRGYVNVESESVAVSVIKGENSTIRCMRIDTAVNKGNSGGGLYNSNGDLIGIVNAKKIDEEIDNMAYAIPSNLVKHVVENIMYYCDKTADTAGKVLNLGLVATATDSYAAFDEVTGELRIYETLSVKSTDRGSIASRYFETGDELVGVEINGEYHAFKTKYQADEIILSIRAGDSVAYSVRRGVFVISLEITHDVSNYVKIK